MKKSSADAYESRPVSIDAEPYGLDTLMPPPPTFVKKRVETRLVTYCETKIPPHHARDQLRLSFKIRDASMTLFENRANWQDATGPWSESAVARFDYAAKDSKWSLYCRDRNGKWVFFAPFTSVLDFDLALAEIEKDQTGIFWG